MMDTDEIISGVAIIQSLQNFSPGSCHGYSVSAVTGELLDPCNNGTEVEAALAKRMAVITHRCNLIPGHVGVPTLQPALQLLQQLPKGSWAW